MIVKVDSPAFAELIDPAAELTRSARATSSPRGRCGTRASRRCTSATSPATLGGDGRRRPAWSCVARPTFKGNGLAFDVDGSLLVCEQVSSCLTANPTRRPARARRLALPGRLPEQPQRRRRAGRRRQHLLHRSRLRAVERLDRVQARVRPRVQGRLPGAAGRRCRRTGRRQPDEFEQPNGLCFSPDESLLYVNDSPRAEIKVYDVAADGVAGNWRMFLDKIGQGDDGRGQPRRHGVRRARQHLDVGPRRRVGARPDGRAHRARSGRRRSAAASCSAARTCARCS